MKNNILELPEGYHEILSIDMQKDQKLALFINGLGVSVFLIMVLMIPLFPNNHSIVELFNFEKGLGVYFMRWGLILIGIILYAIFHELVHGITMKLIGTKKVKYGYTSLYAYAGSDEYYNKKSYLTIALAPIVFWGIVLAIALMICPHSWWMTIYFIQCMNIAGGMGDAYVTYRFSSLPDDIYVKDAGVSMKAYSKEKI